MYLPEPETTIGRKRRSSESVPRCHFPHTSKQLHEATIAKRQADNNVGGGDVSRLQVDQAEDEGSQRESRQAERTGVGEFPERRLVGSNAHLTTEGRVETLVVGDIVVVVDGRLLEVGVGVPGGVSCGRHGKGFKG